VYILVIFSNSCFGLGCRNSANSTLTTDIAERECRASGSISCFLMLEEEINDASNAVGKVC
jgi:hypothetical protein